MECRVRGREVLSRSGEILEFCHPWFDTPKFIASRAMAA